MLILGEGRILFWEGASLWVLAAGPEVGEAGVKGTFHSHHAVQVTLALDGWFELESGEQRVTAAAAAVAPDTRHALRGAGLVAFVFIEPESQSGRSVCRRLFGEDPLTAVSSDLLGDLPQRLAKAISDSRITDAKLTDLGRAIIERLAGGVEVASPDARVSKVITWVSTHLDGPVCLADAATIVNLSPDRLRHLFVQQTGLSFRTYLLWRRLLKAVAAFTNGESLTDAAHVAGFADSAHLSRTFRRMFGVAAVTLRVDRCSRRLFQRAFP
jgi:AraC family transcriptional regulator